MVVSQQGLGVNICVLLCDAKLFRLWISLRDINKQTLP